MPQSEHRSISGFSLTKVKPASTVREGVFSPDTRGARVGSHEIVGPISAGGMGEVYRARDPKLNRDVAIT
jgi:hypothetical protein